MKKVVKVVSLALVLIFVISSNLSAQKCKFDYEKKDPLTGEYTRGNTFGVTLWWFLGINQVDASYYIGVLIRISGNLRDIITPENTLIFKLANGEIITLNANNEYLPAANANQYGVLTAYNAQYNISTEDLAKFAASPLVYVKMEIGAIRKFAQELKEKKGLDFQNKAKCILQPSSLKTAN